MVKPDTVWNENNRLIPLIKVNLKNIKCTVSRLNPVTYSKHNTSWQSDRIYYKNARLVAFITKMQYHFDIWKPINVIHQINRKETNHMIISIDGEKVFEKVPFVVEKKSISKLGIDGSSVLQTLQSAPYSVVKYWSLFFQDQEWCKDVHCPQFYSAVSWKS